MSQFPQDQGARTKVCLMHSESEATQELRKLAISHTGGGDFPVPLRCGSVVVDTATTSSPRLADTGKSLATRAGFIFEMGSRGEYRAIRKAVYIIAFLFLFFAAGARADFDISAWKSRARITGGSVATEYAILQLPPEFFSHLKPDLSDLRIVNADGEVPYVLGVEKESVSSSRVPARMYNLSAGAGGGSVSFLADLGPGSAFHNAITIRVASENFRRGVVIEGSDDEKSWRILTSQGQIFDYTVRDIKSVSVRDTDVRYPEATFRYLRVTISGGPIDVRGVEVSRELALAAREAVYEPAISVQKIAMPGQPTQYLIWVLMAFRT